MNDRPKQCVLGPWYVFFFCSLITSYFVGTTNNGYTYYDKQWVLGMCTVQQILGTTNDGNTCHIILVLAPPTCFEWAIAMACISLFLTNSNLTSNISMQSIYRTCDILMHFSCV
jgi:hypothetical protein